MLCKPGEQFESDVRICQNVAELAYDYLLMSEILEEDFFNEKKESRLMSVFQLISRSLDGVVNNYHMRIKEVPKPSNKVKSIKP
jgi:hypothetical protein